MDAQNNDTFSKKTSPKRKFEVAKKKIEPTLISTEVAPKKFSRFLDPARKPLGYKPPKYWKVVVGIHEGEAVQKIEEFIKRLYTENSGTPNYQLPFRITSTMAKVLRQFRQDGTVNELSETTIRLKAEQDFNINEIAFLYDDSDVAEVFY